MQCGSAAYTKISDMKVEFLKSGSPDCPLIRLYEFEASEVYHLRRIALRLARGTYQVIALHEEPGVFPIGDCQLTLSRGEKDRGVFETAPSRLAWVLTKSGWFNVAGLIRPFSRGNLSGFQWLSSNSGIQILLSRDGRW
jgi:hypothetical protein